MKADLHFDLPEETHDLELALLAPKLASDVEQVDEQLRAWLKYGHSFANGTQAPAGSTSTTRRAWGLLSPRFT